MDARQKSAIGMAGNAVGWLAYGCFGTLEFGLFALFWVAFGLPLAALAAIWWFREDAFTIPVEQWHEERRLVRHLPSALFVTGIGWATIGITLVVTTWLV
ncbi:hypothetical protein [Halapricum desulfuricans]|uniref:Uncharacterized protein n=1 Tax=Halapricum desulfuricans TaxID=2841257 RepID=A0A897NWQ1_9EURY|nr:hypothetical protein [Halapricum desulfuricans]QSG15059.1 hypothetical protein HSEST_1530 [Halapricum desulfuricans]